jgi:hypothetical protein
MRTNVEVKAREAIMFALKERPSPISKPLESKQQQALEPRPERMQTFDFEKAVDDVMTRFADTLDYLAR